MGNSVGGSVLSSVVDPLKDIKKYILNFFPFLYDVIKEVFQSLEQIAGLVNYIFEALIKLFPEITNLMDSSSVLLVAGLQIFNILLILSPALVILYYTAKFINDIEGQRTNPS